MEIVRQAKILFDNKQYEEFMDLINDNSKDFGEVDYNLIWRTKISESTMHILDDMTDADTPY